QIRYFHLDDKFMVAADMKGCLERRADFGFSADLWCPPSFHLEFVRDSFEYLIRCCRNRRFEQYIAHFYLLIGLVLSSALVNQLVNYRSKKDMSCLKRLSLLATGNRVLNRQDCLCRSQDNPSS